MKDKDRETKRKRVAMIEAAFGRRTREREKCGTCGIAIRETKKIAAVNDLTGETSCWGCFMKEREARAAEEVGNGVAVTA